MPEPDKSSTAQTQAVFTHHLDAFAKGIDELMADYTADSILITPDDEYRGARAIRGFFQAFLEQATPDFWASFKVQLQWIDGPIAYLVWHARPGVNLATDTLYVRNGKIIVQTFTSFA